MIMPEKTGGSAPHKTSICSFSPFIPVRRPMASIAAGMKISLTKEL